MSTLQEKYEAKKMTTEEAISHIEPGDAMVYPISPEEPTELHEALISYDKLEKNSLYRTLTRLSVPELPKEKLKQVSIFLGGDREGMNNGLVELLPNHFGDTVELIKMREDNIVLMMNVSPMNEDGYFSLGLSNCYVGGLLDVASKIIVEVNEDYPFTYGEDHLIHIDDVTAFIESKAEIMTVPAPEIDEESQKIGELIAKLVPDNATLQIGYGVVPSATMNNLTGKKGLGFHTEMLPDKVMDLYDSDSIDNKHKVNYQGEMVTTFALGSKELYKWLDHNENAYFLSVNKSNSVVNIGKESNIYTINATIQVDLLGQCNSEKLPNKYYSSTGGQSDFSKGARIAEGGVGIIALKSTAGGGKFSTIVSKLYDGAAVSTSKNDVDYVVTEHGVARLKGKTINERVEALIAIADPKFRDDLLKEAKELNYIQ